MSTPLAYTLVIATYDRAEELRVTLASVAAQTRPPAEVIVVDSTPGDQNLAVVRAAAIPVRYERAIKPSAAVQRNQGAALVTTPLVAFSDDDIFVPPDSFAKICAIFDADSEEKIGGIAARMEGMRHAVPRGLARCYYRLQAGFAHPTYGAKLFGAAINCLPTYTEPGDDELIPSDWLNAGCVFYRTPLFAREKFPAFDGYSFLEDVHLSARIGRTHRLFFHRNATFEHRDAPSTFKRNTRELARMRLRHQRLVARDILGLREPTLTFKLLLHRLFSSVSILRQHGPTWPQELLGTWT
jgi:GT2 family glycosyltransferase